jgi:hypothetical protein
MSALFRHRFKLLLVSLVGLILIVPVVLDLIPGRARAVHGLVVFGVSTAALLAGTLVVSGRRGARVFALGLLVPSFALETATALLGHAELAFCHHLLRLVFLGFVMMELLWLLFTAGAVTFDTISASLCVYLLLGVAWAHVYVLMETLAPESLFTAVRPGAGLAGADGEPALTLRMLYFSFTTLTGVGYGDLVPATTTARMFAITEALMGQAYLYVMVARLVGMQVSQAFAPTAPAPRRDSEPAAVPAAAAGERRKDEVANVS